MPAPEKEQIENSRVSGKMSLHSPEIFNHEKKNVY